MFRDIQIVIITNFVVVSSVGIKRVDCTTIQCQRLGFIATDGDKLRNAHTACPPSNSSGQSVQIPRVISHCIIVSR